MFKKLTFTLFLFVFGFSAASAQSAIKQWEYLEISDLTSAYSINNEPFTVRYYNYLNEGKVIVGTASLDWLGKSGWELVGAISTGENNSLTKLVFKRPYNEQRTKKEIEVLNKSFNAQLKTPSPDLIDLDAQEAKQKLDSFNRQEEERARAALTKIDDLPLKVVSLKSSAASFGKTAFSAEIVIDGTAALLKDSNKYRSSEAKEYLQKVGKRIADSLEFDPNSFSLNYSKFQIGKLSAYNLYGIVIGVSVVINYKERQTVVAQGFVRGEWKKIKP